MVAVRGLGPLLIVVALAFLLGLPTSFPRSPSPALPDVPRDAAVAANGPGIPSLSAVHPAPVHRSQAPSGTGAAPVGPHQFWGPLHPPGGEALRKILDRARGPGPSGATGTPGGTNLSTFCYGVWPTQYGQEGYIPGCYGHDEPGIDAYSTIEGSGGNVTWSVTLPISTDASHTQSQLYSAIWFGMPLSDPFSWLNLCFLELQFYPDTTISGAADLNHWVGAAVAWQIEATSFQENPCFYQTLELNGVAGNYLTMNGGDTVVVRMSGWVGSPIGEQIQVVDQSTHQMAPITLYNGTRGIPLNPAYNRSELPNGLLWTPGGQLPVSFAFEIGHTTYPYPNTNAYGGCSPGVPPPSGADPAVPCPSYDPGSWINNTRQPWEIAPPTFFNANTSRTATQIAFTQDLGGVEFIDPTSNGTCAGRDGSAWCSYPWYSYSCATHAFEFGATNWPGTTADFGKFGEFSQHDVLNALSLGYYEPTNVTVPACGGPSVALSAGAAPGGFAYFANASFGANRTVAGLLPGEYSLGAIAPVGAAFSRWITTGGATVAAPSDPSTSLLLSSNGSVYATFAPTPVTSLWTFTTSNASGRIQIEPGFGSASLVRPTTLADAQQLSLAPGLYSINALPPAGYNFSSWSVASGDARVAAPEVPFTWLDVRSGGGELVAYFAPTRSTTTVVIYVAGPGALTFNGSSYRSAGGNVTYLRMAPGTYDVSTHPDAGSVLSAYFLALSSSTIDFANTTNLTLEPGTTELYVTFAPGANVTMATNGGGRVLLNVSGFQPSGFVVRYPGAPGNPQPIAAEPPPGKAFTGWTVSNASALQVTRPSALVTTVTVLGPGTVTANFGTGATPGLSFTVKPAGAGSILLDGRPYGNGSVNASLPRGLYQLDFSASPGFTFPSWSVSGGAALVAGKSYGWPPGTRLLNVTGPAARVTAVSGVRAAPVTFLVDPGGNGSLRFALNGSTWLPTSTAALPFGTYRVDWTNPFARGVIFWAVSGSLSILSSNRTTADFQVNGSGSVMAILDANLSVMVSVTPRSAGTEAPLTVDFNAIATGGVGSYDYSWNFFQFGSNTTQNPTVLFDAPGSFHWEMDVYDALYFAVVVSGTVVVGGPMIALTMTVQPNRSAAPANLSLAMNVTGGDGPYLESWSVPRLGINLPGSTSRLNLTTPGGFTVVATAFDRQGFRAQASTDIIVVSPLAVSASQSVTQAIAPVNVTFSAAASNGGSVYGYVWEFGDGALGAGPSTQHRYATGGAFEINVTASDELGDLATAHLFLNVSPTPPPLAATLAVVPARIVLGDPVTFYLNATGGLGAYTYRWLTGTLPFGCRPPPNASEYRCVPYRTGNYTVVAGVNDSAQPPHSAVAAEGLEVLAKVSVPPSVPAKNATSGFQVPWTGLLAGGTVAAAAAVAFGLLLWRRRGPPPTSVPSTGPRPVAGTPGPAGSPPWDEGEATEPPGSIPDDQPIPFE